MAKSKKTEENIVTDVPQPDDATTETFTVKVDTEDAIDIMEYLSEPGIKLGVDNRKKIEVKMTDGRLVKGIIRPLSSDESVAITQFASENGISMDKLVIQKAFYGMDGKTHIPDLLLEKFTVGVCADIVTQIMEFSGYGADEQTVEAIKKN